MCLLKKNQTIKLHCKKFMWSFLQGQWCFFFFLPPGFFRQNSSLMWCFLSAESWVSNVPKASINRSIQTHSSGATLLHNDNTTLTSKGLSSPEKGDPFLFFFLSQPYLSLIYFVDPWHGILFVFPERSESAAEKQLQDQTRQSQPLLSQISLQYQLIIPPASRPPEPPIRVKWQGPEPWPAPHACEHSWKC